MPHAIPDLYPSLHQTVHVAVDGTVTHGMAVPHEGVNVECGAQVGQWLDPASGVRYPKRCHKRALHPTPKGEEQHVAVDIRIVASPSMVVHGQRFAPNGIPAGVDQNIVNREHDCDNHWPETNEVLRRGW